MELEHKIEDDLSLLSRRLISLDSNCLAAQALKSMNYAATAHISVEELLNSIRFATDIAGTIRKARDLGERLYDDIPQNFEPSWLERYGISEIAAHCPSWW